MLLRLKLYDDNLLHVPVYIFLYLTLTVHTLEITLESMSMKIMKTKLNIMKRKIKPLKWLFWKPHKVANKLVLYINASAQDLIVEEVYRSITQSVSTAVKSLIVRKLKEEL